MKRWQAGILILVVLLTAQGFASAAGFEWVVNCKEVDASGRSHFWVGYASETDLPDSYLAYSGNGPGIYFDMFQAGQHDRVIEVLLPNEDDAVTLWLYPEDISITITNEAVAGDCTTNGSNGTVDRDDRGVVNNPFVNPRANACYTPGQVCSTEAEWEAGWYLIRQQYGVGEQDG